MEDIFAKLYDMTAFSNIIADPSFLVMYAIAFILLYLGIKKHYEPLLLVPIAFGVLIANFPGGEMGVIQADENGMVMVGGVMKNIWEMPLHEIAHDLGLMNFIYYMLIKTGFLPPVIFMGVGALTDFGPMLRNLRLSIFGAAAQLGIFTVLLCAVMIGFTPQEAGALGIIGGADGPTAIFTTIKLAPHLLGPIAIAAYSYMALVPVIIPMVVKLFCTKKELMINMKEQEKLYPSKIEIKNLRVLKIIFPIAVTTIVALFVPTAVPLIGMLMFGNLIKEIGSDTSRLFDAAANSIMNAATIFLGLSVGATMTSEAFLNWTTIGIVIGGFLAFALSITGGIFFVKLFCTKKELMINMKEQEKLYPSKTEIKNLRVLKIIFPIAVTTIVALFVPTAVPLIGMLMFGNLIKEIGSDTSRLFDAAANSIMNAATIFLGLSVGATMTSEAFLNWTTIGIVIGGFLAFALSITGGIFFVKLFNLFSKKKINPLIGATGLSAVPMASRVCNEIATKYDPKNHVLNYCMSSNISGVIGSAVAAGVLISFLG